MSPSVAAWTEKVLFLAATAQAEAAEAVEAAESSGVITQYLSKGGWMMYVILGVSIFGFVVFLDRAFDLYIRRRLGASAFLAGVVEHLEAGRLRQALDACAVPTRHPLAQVVRAGLLRSNRREKEVERAMEQQMIVALPDLSKRVGLLGLLANISTLLGLLGTIFGLIAAFTSVAAATAAERQEALAGGISQAMYTTAFGIAVAVPLLLFHHILSRRTEGILMEVQGGATTVMVTLAGAQHALDPPSPTFEDPAADQ